MRLVKITCLFFVFLIALSGFVLAGVQGEEAALIISQFDWRYVGALLINSVLVVLLVQFLKPRLPGLPDSVKQIIALVAGPLLIMGQTALSALLGYPIDFGLLVELFAGLSVGFAAMGMFDIGKRARVLKGG